MSAMFSPSVSRPFTCTERTTPKVDQVHQPKLRGEHWYISAASPTVCRSERAATHHVVVNGEVVVELDDALGLHLELPVGLLGPPLLDVAVAVVLASWGPRDMASMRGVDTNSPSAHHLLHFSAAQLNPEPTLAAGAPSPSQASCSPSQPDLSNKSDGWLSAKETWKCAAPQTVTLKLIGAVWRLVGRHFTPS